ncbi:DUF2799 domain-containing protein [Photobacterium aphoticum]|uniref:DUF2799 domain-containing protein n=1 Tax=Photobacterium aphoticum TaxID=754436 RepID=UPI00069E569E|nr:DUF2799 domain-containing protein [Photobacterium aphoticum]PSU54659.1 DUF2799 domain-containing protein [Photobacterium aphoticum]GHA45768.1 hypothetical protein GCM10007086_19250 [Photobacterium aphoticum]
MKRLVSLVLAGLLSACSGLSNDAKLAQQNHWEQLGYQDGMKGRFARSDAALDALHPLTADEKAKYHQGYQYGIEHYCTPYKTYEHGKDGVAYIGQCKNTPHETLALQGWEAGYQYFLTHSDQLWPNDE